jgi:predicted dehydrogenase
MSERMSERMIRLGVIGASEGNGHPFSWSAICNGYDPAAMENCGFPVIPRYLEQQAWPEAALPDVAVTHVWTQDPVLSRHIAKAALIPHVLDDFREMIGAVDGVLLARDDAENHAGFALPFLEAGVPIYIDKPLATRVADARRLIDAQVRPGQLFTCSALRYARELTLTEEDARAVGRIRQIQAITPKDWERYAVHAIEPALLLLPERGALVSAQRIGTIGEAMIEARFADGTEMTVQACGKVAAPIAIRVIGEAGWRDLVFRDAFSAFKGALADFVSSVRAPRQAISPDFMLEVVSLIEAGCKRD